MKQDDFNANPRKYRSSMEIVGQILNIVAEGNGGSNVHINKTKIMYLAMLSYAQLKEYLSLLAQSGLLDYDSKEDGTYKITEKGMNFLKVYNGIGEYVSLE